jgi:hypothetical protein
MAARKYIPCSLGYSCPCHCVNFIYSIGADHLDNIFIQHGQVVTIVRDDHVAFETLDGSPGVWRGWSPILLADSFLTREGDEGRRTPLMRVQGDHGPVHLQRYTLLAKARSFIL